MPNKNYWQIAAGDGGRDYSEYFLKFGVATVGGKPNVSTMMEKVKCGDIAVLKQGTSKILAAGKIVERNGVCVSTTDSSDEGKRWFDDFDGWEQPAYCHVDWHKADPPLEVGGLGRGTINRSHKTEVHQAASRLIDEAPVYPRISPPYPVELISEETLISFLVEQGLRPSDAENLTDTFRRIRLLAVYYRELTNRETNISVKEDETRAFLILPFLSALGWTEQQLKLELKVPHNKGYIDIAGFRQPYKGNNEDCILIVEAKSLAGGLDFTFQQAKAYAEEFPNCQVIVTSNGYCYKTYHRKHNQNAFSEKPSAYLNLLSPTTKYHLDTEIDGAREVLRWLLPMSLIRQS